jgi:hypothetical protein
MERGKAELVNDFSVYVKCFVRKKIEILKDSDVPDFEEWLEGTPYSGKRKEYFRKLRDDFRNERFGDLGKVESFIKHEGWAKPKCPRAINSYSDLSKTILGPIVKAIDKNLFKLKYFVKGTNPREWPEMMRELFGDRKVQVTDFTSFEAHHRGIFADLVYYWMAHSIRGMQDAKQIRAVLRQLVLGRNHITYNCTNVEIDQRLMSGAMWTSSANGFLNLMLMSFMTLRTLHPNVASEKLIEKIDDFVGKVEGDDGICLDVGIKEQMGIDLGCKLKWERKRNFAGAGFCSIFCDYESNAVMKDPKKVLREMFMLDPKYVDLKPTKKMALLRCRALSYAYCFPGSPIVSIIAKHVLRRTRSIDVRPVLGALEARQREFVEEASHKKWEQLFEEITPSARIIVQEEFGICVQEQLRIESAFNGQRDTVVCDLLAYVSDEMLDHSLSHITDNPLKAYNKPLNHLPQIIKDICAEGFGESQQKNKRRVGISGLKLR